MFWRRRSSLFSLWRTTEFPPGKVRFRPKSSAIWEAVLLVFLCQEEVYKIKKWFETICKSKLIFLNVFSAPKFKVYGNGDIRKLKVFCVFLAPKLGLFFRILEKYVEIFWRENSNLPKIWFWMKRRRKNAHVDDTSTFDTILLTLNIDQKSLK